MHQKGVTLLELILVLVIIAIGASLAVPKLRRSVENREAKAALETLRSISQAVRMYEVTKGELPANLYTLETETTTAGSGTGTSYGTRYLDPTEYAFSPPYTYEITSLNPVILTASRAGRTITLTQCGNANKSKDGEVTDSGSFLSSPAAC